MSSASLLSRTESPAFAGAVDASFPSQVALLVAAARRSLEQDLALTRRYLDRLSALFEGDGSPADYEHLLLARCPGGAEPPRKGGLAAWQLRKVVQHIDDHLDGPLQAGFLAALIRLSTGHFCRAFRVSVGETPHNYVIRQRLRHAQTLMLETRLSLSDIASASGLTDQAHLTRLFRRLVGTTPLSWRRAWQEAPDRSRV